MSSSSIPSSASGNTHVDPYGNPYYLREYDHCSLLLVEDRLTGHTDFNSWKRRMEIALISRNKLGFVDGTLPRPPDGHPDAGTWSRVNEVVSFWVMNSVSEKLAPIILYKDSAQAMWEDLHSCFGPNVQHLYWLHQKLHNIKQGSNDLQTYDLSLRAVWEEYKYCTTTPVCSCGKCECNVEKRWMEFMEREYLMKFLMGLNDSYSAARTRILMSDPLPGSTEAFRIIAQEEQLRLIKPKVASEAVSFQAGVSSAAHCSGDIVDEAITNYRPKQRPICTHCGLLGHTINRCYMLHGYPPGYRSPPQGSGHVSTPR
ncbi:PREDICTED: uncharacterized protein LOC104817731 isoform X1 [Tarenaya hassleriana]|uniref:uncharacterized protein LOC104817731 isoform X1 n=1 Tax=Tarenaya hassleriana TaxID=28532 RepID=UPI00053C7EEE|nr:PREDICTED: uncharacterized protein LOC104817731 isoform X1 [Tarenaya hassleriana]